VTNTPAPSDAPSASGLTHLDSDGRARMVDVGDKAVTSRTAVATGRIELLPHVIDLVRADDLPKADVLATARIAGISGAKKTSELIPLCHQIPLSSVKIDFTFAADSIEITATAKTTGQTGVEMEALTAVAVAGLTLHDMVKALDPGAILTDIQLRDKTGGKRGHWTRADREVAPARAAAAAPTRAAAAAPAGAASAPSTPRPRTAAVVVASTGGAAGTVVVNQPGSPGGVKDGLAVLDGLLDHLVAQISGGGAHE
jgi:cyclic pyranopterin phosphate synthase